MLLFRVLLGLLSFPLLTRKLKKKKKKIIVDFGFFLAVNLYNHFHTVTECLFRLLSDG